MGQYSSVLSWQAAMRIYRVLLVCMALLLMRGTAVTAGAASFTASLDTPTIAVGETATLSLTFSGGEPRALPAIPPRPGLQITSMGRSSSMQIANGQVTSTVTFSYRVYGTQPGEYTIPGLTAVVGSERLTSQPLRITVTKPTPPPSGAAANQLAFIRLHVPRTNVYEGEILPAELQLFVRQGVQGVENFQLVNFPAEGFNPGKMVEGPRRQARIGNMLFTIFSWSFPMKVLRSGTLELGPVAANVVVQIPSTSRTRDSLLDQFFGGGTEQRQVSLASETLKVNALPLPADSVPDSFAGAIGSYDMSITVGPTNVAVGDPITIKVQITGSGPFDTVALSDNPNWKGFKGYPPTSKLETTDPLGLQGTKSFEQVVVPEDPALKQMPPIRFTFFDPESRRYRTLSNAPTQLIVRPSQGGSVPTVAPPKTEDAEQPGMTRDIVHIRPRLGTIAPPAPPLLRQGWFLGIQAVPLLALFLSILYRRRAEKLASNPKLVRGRKVAGFEKDNLPTLRALAQSNNSNEFFQLATRLLQERLGERLDVPASSITDAVVEEQLRPRGVPDPLLDRLESLFQAANQAKYAPIKSAHELSSLATEVECALQDLRGLNL